MKSNEQGPDWQNLSILERNTVQPHAHLIPYEDWDTQDYDTSEWDTIPVPANWQLDGYGKPHYSSCPYPFPINPPYVPSAESGGLLSEKLGAA